MNLVITLTSAGTDTGPFNLYSDVDGFTNAFDVNVSKADLLAGFPTANVPDGTIQVKIQSINELCTNSLTIGLVPLEYYFMPEESAYVVDFIENGSTAYVYGYFNGYFNGSYIVPGNLLVKLNADRSVDTSFDIQEGFNFDIVYIGATLFQQLDGKIILSGFYTSFNGVLTNRITRLNIDGSIDNTFNSGLGFNNYTTKISKDSSNNLYVTGLFSTYNGATSPRIIKLLPNGTKDTTFNPGTGFNNATIDILHNPDDTFYVTGYFTQYNGLARKSIVKLFPSGLIDNSFVVGTGFNTSVNQTIGLARITGETSFYAAGFFTSFNGISLPYITKLTSIGTIDSSFDPGTGFNGVVGGIKVIWTNKLFCSPASAGTPFSSYNGVATPGSYIILNADGTILKTWPIAYTNMYIIGFNVFGQPVGGENQLIYTFTP